METRTKKIRNIFGAQLMSVINFINWLLLAIVFLTVVALNFEFWLLDIYVSYVPQIFIVLATLFIVMFTLYGRYIIRDGWSACWASLGKKEAAMFLAVSVLTLYMVTSSLLIINPVPAKAVSSKITVGTYNSLYTNQEIYQAAYFFANNNTDIVALQETTPELVNEAKKILNYEYSLITDCDCSAEQSEVGLISKYPLSNDSIVAYHQNGVILRAEAIIDAETTIAVYAVHIPPPINSSSFTLRNNFLDLLDNAVVDDSLEAVVMGDFNTTIFSPSMQRFIENTSESISNTSEKAWPKCSWFGYGELTCARIDHILASNNFGLGQRYIGSNYGSDHRPIAVELSVK